MKAMVATQFGGPEVLKMQELDRPQPGAKQILVKVVASSVNPVDFKIREMGRDFGLEAPMVLGFDASGVVEEAGPEVEDFKVGDEVFYTSRIAGAQGCNAEYHAVDEAIAVEKPANLSHEQAAAIPLAASTAWQALMVRSGLRLGETVLIHGAGGVGSFAVQMAVATGAKTLVSCSDYMVDNVRAWGADTVINYKEQDFVEGVKEATYGEGVDVVFNTVGGDLLTQSIPVVRMFGTLAGILDPEGSMAGAYRKNLSLELVFLQRERETMQALHDLATRGVLVPLIDSVVDLKDLADAHSRLEKGGVKGKIVVKVA
jgi:NADPH2:quinone reductase